MNDLLSANKQHYPNYFVYVIFSAEYFLSFRSPSFKSSKADDVQKGKLPLPDPVFQSTSHIVEMQFSYFSQAFSLNWLATNLLGSFTETQCSQ